MVEYRAMQYGIGGAAIELVGSLATVTSGARSEAARYPGKRRDGVERVGSLGARRGYV